jgi:hypothetical protein
MIYVARWVSRKRKYSDSGQKAREVREWGTRQ